MFPLPDGGARMPLEWLIILVVGGIAGAALLTWAFGWSRPFHIANPETAHAEWARHWPEAPAIRVLITPDGRAALVETAGGPGLLRSFGADTVAHMIHAHRADDTTLTLDFADFASPPARLRLDKATLALWTGVLEEAP